MYECTAHPALSRVPRDTPVPLLPSWCPSRKRYQAVHAERRQGEGSIDIDVGVLENQWKENMDGTVL